MMPLQTYSQAPTSVPPHRSHALDDENVARGSIDQRVVSRSNEDHFDDDDTTSRGSQWEIVAPTQQPNTEEPDDAGFESIGPWILLDTIGAGKQAEVCLAVHAETNERCAIKVLKKDTRNTADGRRRRTHWGGRRGWPR